MQHLVRLAAVELGVSGERDAMAKRRKLPFYAISAVTGLGVEKLKYAVGERVRDLRAESPAVPAAS